MDPLPICFLCNGAAKSLKRAPLNGTSQFECATCGKYAISDEAKAEIDSEPACKPLLSIATRKANATGQHDLNIITTNWREICSAHEHTSIGTKIGKLL